MNMRKDFENAIFNRYLMTFPIPVYQKTKEDFTAKQPDGTYLEESVNAAWWAWQLSQRTALEELRKVVAEMLSTESSTIAAWPVHGNIPLDIAAIVALLKNYLSKHVNIINEVHSWIVCAPISSAEDMMQNAVRIEKITRLE